MKVLCLFLFFYASLQLECDRNKITAHVGGEFLLICKYNTNRFLYSKKYWCQGDSSKTCEILVDSVGLTKTRKTHRSLIIDLGRRGLVVKVTELQFEDAGVYWVGIDKAYADIMTAVHLTITEVPVSKPRLWPVSSLLDRPTCWGQPVTVRCGCTKGTGVRFTWYEKTPPRDVLLHHTSDLYLYCSMVDKNRDYYCVAANDVNSESSDTLSVQMLMAADTSCIYVVNIQGQPNYDCADRMSTTTVTTPTLTMCQTAMKIHGDTRNQSVQLNQTHQDLFYSWEWARFPFWYTLLRWGLFFSMLIVLCIVIGCIKMAAKGVERKRARALY